jgi:ubiquinone biosynthesis protein
VKSIKHSFRAVKINYIFIRYGLDDVLFSTPWLKPLKGMRYLNPWNWMANRGVPRAVRLRLALERLGPIFVKFGQILSTRYDMLPEDVIVELAKLRDNVPPFSSVLARKMIEKQYGKPAEEVFAQFDDKPLASASVAQVHAATLFSGEKVVVKLLRPNIEKQIKSDLSLLTSGAGLLEKYWKRSRRFKPVEMVAEVERCFTDEVNLKLEAANAAQLKKLLAKDRGVYIPEVYWDYSHQSILVMERIYGTPVADMEALEQQGVDFKRLAEDGLKVFFTQIFRDRYFHADLHPGNIFIEQTERGSRYQLVDFGIVGSLTESDQRYIAENLLAFLKRDYQRVAALHIECGWVPATASAVQFEAAIRSVCEPIFNRPIKDISLGKLLVGLIQTARRFEMNIQPQLILLQKTLFQIEGLSRRLDPELNMWVTIKPIIEKWLKEKMGPKAFLKKIKHQLPIWLDRAPDLPDLIHEALTECRKPRTVVKTVIEKQSNSFLVIVLIALLLVLFFSLNTALLPLWGINVILGVALIGLLLHLLVTR